MPSVRLLAAVCALTLTAACAPQARTAGPEAEQPTAQTTSAAPESPSASTSATPSPEPSSATPSPSEQKEQDKKEQKAQAMLARGSSGTKVRELQHRLRQVDWFSGAITGSYQASTVTAVKGFQGKRDLPTSGEVDTKTWNALVSMTRMPTEDEMHNRIKPGPALWKKGADGVAVRKVQARLKQVGWFSGKVTGFYGSDTVSAVRGFQAKRAIPVTGEVDQRTWNRLTAMTSEPTKDALYNRTPKPSAAGLDPRCMTGRAMCVSKSTNSLVWVIDGKPQLRMDVRFGSAELPTREGSFRVGWKSRDHVSSLYHTKMPYAMFFSGGQAVHYSPDFAARGYNGASHGCVNVRNLAGIQSLFAQVRVGDKVIVHR